MQPSDQIATIKSWLGTGSINIFGRPFSGKDTQAKRLADYFGGEIIGGGEILREVNNDEANNYVRNGKLIPSNLYVQIISPYLSQAKLADKPFILSSLGRWNGEQLAVMECLQQSHHPLKAVIYLDISNDESFRRWQMRDINNDRQNRHDDTESVLKTRFNEFQDKTMPVIEYYKKNNMLISINGLGDREEIAKNIIDALYNKASV